MQDLLIEIEGRVAIVVHRGRAYTPAGWRSILALAQRSDLGDLRILAYDDGGTLSAAQRAELLTSTGGRMPTAAVLTSSAVSRGVVTAIGWFKPGVKAFPPGELERAADHLGLTEKERAVARSLVERHLRRRPVHETA